MGDDAPTEFAPTALAVKVEAEPVTAWSEDDDEEWVPPHRSWWPVLAVVAVSLAGVGVAIGAAWGTLDRSGDDVSSSPVTTTTVVTTAPGPASTPPATFDPHVPDGRTIVPPKPTLVPPPDVAVLDREFLKRMLDQGWSIDNPALMAHRAHETCAMLQSGEPLWSVRQKMVAQLAISPEGAQQFTAAAMITYPSCP